MVQCRCCHYGAFHLAAQDRERIRTSNKSYFFEVRKAEKYAKRVLRVRPPHGRTRQIEHAISSHLVRSQRASNLGSPVPFAEVYEEAPPTD